jgi:hypothetical protein
MPDRVEKLEVLPQYIVHFPQPEPPGPLQTPAEAYARTPAEITAHERAEAAGQAEIAARDAWVRTEERLRQRRLPEGVFGSMSRVVDVTTDPEWREAYRLYQEAQQKSAVLGRTDHLNELARMERRRQATIRAGEAAARERVERERQAREARAQRAASLGGRIARLVGRE